MRSSDKRCMKKMENRRIPKEIDRIKQPLKQTTFSIFFRFCSTKGILLGETADNMKICIKIASKGAHIQNLILWESHKSYTESISNTIQYSNYSLFLATGISLTKVTRSTEDGKILSQSSSFATSQINTFIRFPSKFECDCIHWDSKSYYIYRYSCKTRQFETM